VSIELEIKYEGFGGGPLLVGGLGPGPPGPPLNPALVLTVLALLTSLLSQRCVVGLCTSYEYVYTLHITVKFLKCAIFN